MSKPIIKLYSFPTSYQIREKLAASGIDLKPFEAVKVSVVIKPKTRRKIKSGVVVWHASDCPCCSDHFTVTFSGKTQYIY